MYLENLFCVSSREPKIQLTRNLVRNTRVTFWSKTAKFVPIKNPTWPQSWKSILNKLIRNLIGSIRVTCRSKIARISKIVALAAMLEISFEFFIQNQKVSWLDTSLEVSRWIVDQKKLKSFWLEIQYDRSLENLIEFPLSRKVSCFEIFLKIRYDTEPFWSSFLWSSTVYH